MTFVQIIVLMVLAHLVSDYTLQGWLADGKQKSWWEKLMASYKLELKDTMYKYDYIAALICHSLYWSIFICLPVFNSPHLLWAILLNAIVHGVVDDLKANRHLLNLIEDQTIHFIQILITAFVLA